MPLIQIEDTRRQERRPSVVCRVGGIPVGGNHPVVVQSMTNTDTANAAATAEQAALLAAAGSELVRVTVNTREAAAAVPEIARRLRDRGVTVPLVGDFHYNGHTLLTSTRSAHGSSTSTGSTPATSAWARSTTTTSGA